MLYLQSILLSLAVILLAHAGLAEPIFVNLLPDGNKQEKIEVPLEAAELSTTLNDMLIDSESVTKKMRTDKNKHYVDLPVNHADKRTLSAIANALMAMQKLKQNKKEYRFGPMKSIVKDFCFPTSKPATSTDLINFLLVANFLDIKDLLRPATAAWVDLKQKEFAKKKITRAQLDAILSKQEQIPRELLPLFRDYVDWLNNPTSLIKPNARPVELSSSTGNLAAVGNKLYLTSYNEDTITVIDCATDKVIGAPIKVGRDPSGLAVIGNKLYVSNSGSNTLSVIDVTTDKVIGDPIIVGMNPSSLAVAGSKLYVYWSGEYSISAIDSVTDQVMGDPIVIDARARNLKVVGNKLYAPDPSGYDGIIRVINLATNKVVPVRVGGVPGPLAFFGNKLYVAVEGKGIVVMDPATDKVFPDPIEATHFPKAMADVGNKLFVLDRVSGLISVIDVTKRRLIGSPIKVDASSLLAAVGNKLYAASTGAKAKLTVLDLEMFNYYSFTP